MAFKQGHALIIGVGTYKHSSSRDAPLTVEDAQELADVLRNPRYAGYPDEQVTVLTEARATRQALLDAFDDLAATTTEADTVLLFYAGHGDYDKEGVYYLTTHDTQWERRKVVAGTGVREDELLQKLNAIQATRAILLFNSYHSGEISPDALGDLGGEDEPTGEPVPNETATAMLGTGEGRVIITACREAQKSWFDRRDPLTFFGDALSEGLQGRGVQGRRGVISIFDLYSKVYEDVKAEVNERSRGTIQQEPELTIHKGIGTMAVALYRGSDEVGSLGPDDRPDALPNAVREVAPAESQATLQQLLSGDIRHSVIAGRDAKQAGGDLVEGDQMKVEDSQGVIGEVSGGQVEQHIGDRIRNEGGVSISGGSVSVGGDLVGRDKVVEGDQVQGDKVGGDQISVGDISGASGIAIGRGARADVRQGTTPPLRVATWEEVRRAIQARPADEDVDKEEIADTVERIEAEATKPDAAANENKVRRWLTTLADMAPDIHDVTLAALTNPALAVATVVRKVAARARAEGGDGGGD